MTGSWVRWANRGTSVVRPSIAKSTFGRPPSDAGVPRASVVVSLGLPECLAEATLIYARRMRRPFPDDIFTEPEASLDVLAMLGPLAPLAGVWEGHDGVDVHPVESGSKTEAYFERFELQPIDPQVNGPQLFYGLKYEQRVDRPNKPVAFHHQVGYLLWEPAANTVLMMLSIPRGLVALGSGIVAPDAREFTLSADADSRTNGILANPFVDWAFHTSRWEITFTVNDDGSFGYDQTTVLHPRDRDEPFLHTDRNTLHKVAEPSPNPAVFNAELLATL